MLGAVLTQFDSSGHEHVISFVSRLLTDRERQYSAMEKKALVVAFATDHFTAYLLGRKFTVVTHHLALYWLHSLSRRGRMARWIMDLQEYSFDVRHRTGANNGNADALSRLPTSPSCATTVQTGYNLVKTQHDDHDTSTVIQMKSNHQPWPPFSVWSRNPILRTYWHCWDLLHTVNGFLVKDIASSNRPIPVYGFVLPGQLITSVLHGIHKYIHIHM